MGVRYEVVRTVAAPTPRHLDATQATVVAHDAGPLRVVGGPGTGKTTTLIEAVAARVAADARPDAIVVLTFGQPAAAALRRQIVQRIGQTTSEPLARTFHSYAYGLLRQVAAQRGHTAPRLLSGPEQDVVIRELLAGDAGGAGVRWPERLRPVLTTRGFASELRDLLQRAYERGIDATTLDKWGRRFERDDWRAAARFLQQYADVTELRDAARAAAHAGGAAYDPAELISAAVALLRRDSTLLAAARAQCSHVFVDEYHDVDPAHEELLQLLAGGGRFVVVFGDPHQSIFGFRGTDPAVLRRFDERFTTVIGAPAATVELGRQWRATSTVAGAAARIAARLRGSGAPPLSVRVPRTNQDKKSRNSHTQRMAGAEAEQGEAAAHEGEASAHIFPTAAAEAAYVAHRFRHAHLLDGVPYAQMAVIVRSPAQLVALRRALARADVPVWAAADEVPLVQQPAVRPFLLLLRCALDPDTLDETAAAELLTSPFGRGDELGLHRLRQALAGVPLATAVQTPAELVALDEHVAASAQRIVALLQQVTAAASAGGTVEEVLWQAWDASGLAAEWAELATGTGASATTADRDLDAMVALFAAAARFTDRLPAAGLVLFLEHIQAQQLPGEPHHGPVRGMPPTDAVHLLTAHAAKGQEFAMVAVVGVTEGRWPDLRLRGSVLGAEDLVDVAANRPLESAGRLTRLLDEERRLFYVAVSRARHTLLVTAVSGEDETPSRFLDELDPLPPEATREFTRVPRSLTLAGLVAQLRRVVVDPVDPRRDAAAAMLAELMQADVAAADPQRWYGVAALSDARSLAEPAQRVSISPSNVEKFLRCGFRWFAEACGAQGPATAKQGIGVAVHELAATYGGRPVSRVELATALDETLATMAAANQLELGSGWIGTRNREQARRMVGKLADWLGAPQRTFVAAERAFEVEVGERALLRGRVDRLECDDEGRLHVIDFKTGGTAAAKAEIGAHPQLGMYQLAVRAGAFSAASGAADSAAAMRTAAGMAAREPGGASLVQLGTSTVSFTEQTQPALSPSDDADWAAQLADETAAGMGAHEFVAQENTMCRICPVKGSCPLHSTQL